MNDKIGIFTLNWNSFDNTCSALESIFNINYPNYEVLLVDNGSYLDKTEDYNIRFSKLKIIRIDKNIGFTGGSNVGIKYFINKKVDFILFISNDVVVDPNFVIELFKVIKSDEEIGIVTPRIYYYKPSDVIWFDGGKFNYFKARGIHLNFRKKRTDIRNSTQISFFTGCVYLARITFFRKVGLFDNKFFNYFEDADLSLRAIKNGFKIYYVPTSIVYHKESYDIVKNKGKYYQIYYLVRNNLLLVRKHYKTLNKVFFYIYFIGKYLIMVPIYYIIIMEFKSIFSIYLAIYDYITGNFGKRENL